MKLKQWTIGFFVDGERRDFETPPPRFWRQERAQTYARRITAMHRAMYGDLHAKRSQTLEYRAVRR